MTLQNTYIIPSFVHYVLPGLLASGGIPAHQVDCGPTSSQGQSSALTYATVSTSDHVR